MSLLRVYLAFSCLVCSLAVSADRMDNLMRERAAQDELSFQQCLKDLEEGPLEPLVRDRSREVYRMVYLPSFFPQVSMRVNVVPNGTGRLTMRSIPSYCGGRNPLIEQEQLALSAADVSALRDAYARADFWRRVGIE